MAVKTTASPVSVSAAPRYSESAIRTAELLVKIREIIQRLDAENGLPDRFVNLERKDISQ